MKRKILTGALILFAIVTKAQEPPAAPAPPSLDERMKRVSEIMKKEIAPTDKQELAITEAFKKFFYAADQVRKDNPPPPPPPPDPKVKAAMEKLEKERDESVRKVLTAEQFEKYKEAAKKMRPPGPPPPQGVKDPKAPPPPPKPK